MNTEVAAAPLHYYSTPIDHRVSMRIVLARVLWLEGLAEQARSMAALALEYAREDSPYSVCQVLALASCPIAAWRGDWDDAAALAAALDEHAARYRLSRWRLFARHYANQPAEGSDDREVGGSAPEGLIAHTLLTFGRGISLPAEAALESNSWCAPELLRLQADQAVAVSGSSGFDRAEAALFRSLELAERQNTLAWRLRTAISLASLWRQMDRLPEAMTCSLPYMLFFPRATARPIYAGHSVCSRRFNQAHRPPHHRTRVFTAVHLANCARFWSILLVLRPTAEADWRRFSSAPGWREVRPCRQSRSTGRFRPRRPEPPVARL